MVRLETRTLIAACFASTVACTHRPAPALAPEGPEDAPRTTAPVHVVVRQEAPGGFFVTFKTAQSVRALQLLRSPNDRRAREWRPLSDAFELAYDPNAAERVQRVDGAAFSQVELWVPATYESLPKDYAPFAPFSDGGVLIHSARFHACPEAETETETCGQWPVRVVPRPGTGVLAVDRFTRGPVDLVSKDDGLYLYVGPSEPTEGEAYWSILDRRLPQQVRATLDDMLAPLLATFSDRFGPLDQKPMIFVSLDLTDVDGRLHSQGGVIGHQVAMHFQGPAWAERDDYDWLPWFIAHEVAHLFQKTPEVDRRDSWIHEGSAEALAYEVLGRLRVSSEAYLDERLSGAMARCAAGLRQHELAQAADRFSLYYDCGLIMHLAAGRALNDSGPSEVWLELMEDHPREAPLRPEAFFSLVEGYDRPLADTLRQIVEEPQPTATADSLAQRLRIADLVQRLAP